MERKHANYLTTLSPIFFILVLTILFFYPVIFQGKTFYAFDTLLEYLPWSSYVSKDFRAHNPLITDPVNIFYPYFSFYKECIASGTFSFWKGHNFCGMPISPTGNPIAFFSYLFFPQSLAHDFLLWLHLFGAGLFMFLYLREIRLGAGPALIGAISWMFNGYVMVWFEFEHAVIMAPSFAATLYYLELWLRKREKLHCLCLVCAIALSITNGSAQLNIYQLLFVGFYFLCRYFLMRKENNECPKIGKQDMKILSIAAILLICTSSSFLFKNLSLLDDPHRREFSFDELYDKTGKLPAEYLATLIFPDFFGSPAGGGICFTPRDKGAQPYNNYNELCIYSGIVPLFLTLVCIPFLRRKKFTSFYLFSAMITLTMAMGSLLYYPMAKFIPGLNLSAPLRILYVFGFSVSVLAALGADILASIEDKKKTIVIVLWSLLFGAAVAIAIFAQLKTGTEGIFQEHFAFSSPVIWKPLCLVSISFLSLISALLFRKEQSKKVFLLLAILILSYDLISFALFYNTASPRHLEFPETDAIRFLKKDTSAYRIITLGSFMHNGFAPFGIEDAGGYSSFYPKRYGKFLHLSQNDPATPFPDNFSRWVYFRKFGSPLLDLINVKYVLLPSSVSANSPKLRLVYDSEIRIYENTEVFPRAFFVPAYQFCKTRKEAYETLASYTIADFRRKVLLESLPPKDFLQDTHPEGEAETKIRLISHKLGRIEAEVSADQKGFLVLSDNYHSAWEAEVGGESVKILLANYIMRAVPIKAGNCKVVLTFRPDFLISGLIITSIAWAVFGMLITISAFGQVNTFFKQMRKGGLTL